MTTILCIDASPRTTRSLSRALGDTFCGAFEAQAPAASFVRRRLAEDPPPFVTEAWIAAAFRPEADRSPEDEALLAWSNSAIRELEEAKLLVVTTPMYNYGMPAMLKAWVDQVIRIGKTFTFDLARGDRPLEPVLSGKVLVILASCGEFGFEPGGPRAADDHLLPHFATLSHYLGADRMEKVLIEYQEFGDERHARSIDEAHRAAQRLAGELAGTQA